MIVHLGLSKAASTTIRRHLFASHSQIEFLGKGVAGPTYASPIIETIAENLSKCEDDSTLETWRRSVSESLESALECRRVPVLSNESLVSSDHAKLAMNMERVFGPSRVILVVRHPLRWVESYYIHRLQSDNLSGRKPPAGYFTFEDWITRVWDGEGRGALKMLFSRRILEPYVARFGRESVGVFMFEHLRSDPRGFIRAMCEFMGVEPAEGVLHAANRHRNLRMTQDTVEQLKFVHRSPELWRSFQLGTRRERIRMIGFRKSSATANGEDATVEIPDGWRARIEDLVRDDCNYLHHEWELPVGEAGYPL